MKAVTSFAFLQVISIILSPTYGTTSGCSCDAYRDISMKSTIFESRVLPDHGCCMPSIGNGYVATVVFSDTVHMNTVYNGRLGDSHRARIQSTSAIQMILPKYISVKSESYALDVESGTFYRNVTSTEVNIHQRVYAHQFLTRLIINEIVVTRNGGFETPLSIGLMNNCGKESEDINFTVVPPKARGDLWFAFGNTTVSETTTSTNTPVYSYWTNIPNNIVLMQGENSHTWSYITSLSNSRDEALQVFTLGHLLALKGVLFQNHVDAWEHKWGKGRIDISGNILLAKAIYGSMYYILNSLPPLGAQDAFPFHFYGISPAGLAHGGHNQGYSGHIFWDQETWMYPPMLMFHPELALAMLSTRTAHLEAAKQNAMKRGNKGARYPWEMAYTGVEVCPAPPYPSNEIHISGDIAFATQQYLWATNDTEFLLSKMGFDMIKGLAEFWASRVEYNSTLKSYTINNVMPPDEYHHKVNNSVYTNTIAQISLRLPAYAASLINETVPSEWKLIADQMYIPYDTELQYHPEYEGYTPGTVVKQADAIMLGYPLMSDMNSTTRRNDLMMYGKYNGTDVTDPNGPAMTWGMFAVGWLELHNETKAEELFTKSYANIQQPYKIWTETSTGGGAVNFVTGMGGFLQAVLFGYGGMRLKRDGLHVAVTLPSNTEKITFTGINYFGNSLDISAVADSLRVVLTGVEESGHVVNLELVTGEDVYPLILGKMITVDREAVRIQPVPRE